MCIRSDILAWFPPAGHAGRSPGMSANDLAMKHERALTDERGCGQ